MDNLWLLLVVGGIGFYLWRRSQREQPTDRVVAPPVPHFGDESPITREEWTHFARVVRAAIEQATDTSGMIREIPYIYRARTESNYIPHIQAWNDDALKFDERRRGVSAQLFMGGTLYVYTGERKKIDNMIEHERVDRTGQAGPWNAELRGMVRAIEGTL
jgi:hypothetical protein